MGVEWLQWALRSYLINNKTEEKGKRHTNSSRTKPSFVKTPKSEFSSSEFVCFEKKQRQKERKRIYIQTERERERERKTFPGGGERKRKEKATNERWNGTEAPLTTQSVPSNANIPIKGFKHVPFINIKNKSLKIFFWDFNIFMLKKKS